ncbi:uncharacterized protein si:ch211-191i18.4 isoform X2 [Trematomus bernacchii]|uniref:uncharacterized protein si:ch211-191i18.4 isoform X2 n=1 Tax=Trematomus bernacchii TaxID=40690 RepID=UPI001469D84A|nr:uncharacterized protein si:ch211-191i18.4 isoform X2 [Trematomus bernacchii]
MKGQVCFLFLLLVCLQRAGSHLPPRLQVGVSGSEGVSQSEGVSPLKVSGSGGVSQSEGVSPLKVSGSGGVSQSGGVSLKTQKGLRRLPGLCRRLRRRRVTLLCHRDRFCWKGRSETRSVQVCVCPRGSRCSHFYLHSH